MTRPSFSGSIVAKEAWRARGIDFDAATDFLSQLTRHYPSTCLGNVQNETHLFRGGEETDVFVPLEHIRRPFPVELHQSPAEHQVNVTKGRGWLPQAKRLRRSLARRTKCCLRLGLDSLFMSSGKVLC